MRQLLLLFFLPSLLAIDGDEDLKKFIGVPSDIEKDVSSLPSLSTVIPDLSLSQSGRLRKYS